MPKKSPDIKIKCIEAGITQARLAKEIETSAPNVNRVIRSKETIVNNTLVKLMEALGYDIELRYVKREE
ncbi:helix-turn-helix domain-containing protein [Aedoeadaptatus pacaensis]|uniref:helix-turn-helix domain-containing protein n=1 Tax=Aedoeadaptatus pacaensis TaxID=1776390 RepID=UPI0009EF68F3